LKLEDLIFIRVRKSNRLKSSTQKRQFNNLEGLTSPYKRKRKSRSTDKPVKKPATVNKSSTDMDIEVGTSSGADKPATDTTTDHAAVVTPAAINRHGTDAATEDTAVDTPAAINRHSTDTAPEDVAVDILAAVNKHGTDTAAEDTTVSTPSGQTDNSSAVLSSTTENTQIGAQPSPVLSYPLPTIADLLYPEHTIYITTSILLELVNRYNRIG
jgi:hypothetical protein